MNPKESSKIYNLRFSFNSLSFNIVGQLQHFISSLDGFALRNQHPFLHIYGLPPLQPVPVEELAALIEPAADQKEEK